jgi:hypothetical protein
MQADIALGVDTEAKEAFVIGEMSFQIDVSAGTMVTTISATKINQTTWNDVTDTWNGVDE